MNSPKTYILAPNFDSPPGRSISLGNVLADPFTPHRTLCKLPHSDWPAVTTTVHTEAAVNHSAAHGFNLSVGATLANYIATKLAGEAQNSVSTEYTMDSLRTEFFDADPTESAITELLLQECGQGARNILFGLGSVLWPHPLFIVTGLKIAVGLRVSSSLTTRRGANLGANPGGVLAATGIPVTADAEIGGSTERMESLRLQVQGEVVLAYKLVKISRRGWRQSRALRMNEHSLSAIGRMLGDDDSLVVSESRMEIEVAEAHEVDVLPKQDVEPGQRPMFIPIKLAADSFIIPNAVKVTHALD